MLFKDHLEQLNKFAKEHPECLEMETVYAIDEEGNGYNIVYYILVRYYSMCRKI